MGAEPFTDLKAIFAVSNSINLLMVDQPNPLISGSKGVSHRLFAEIQKVFFRNMCSLSRLVVPKHPNT